MRSGSGFIFRRSDLGKKYLVYSEIIPTCFTLSPILSWNTLALIVAGNENTIDANAIATSRYFTENPLLEAISTSEKQDVG